MMHGGGAFHEYHFIFSFIVYSDRLIRVILMVLAGWLGWLLGWMDGWNETCFSLFSGKSQHYELLSHHNTNYVVYCNELQIVVFIIIVDLVLWSDARLIWLEWVCMADWSVLPLEKYATDEKSMVWRHLRDNDHAKIDFGLHYTTDILSNTY